jgi:hypothetical protein
MRNIAIEEWEATWRNRDVQKRKADLWKDILDMKSHIKLMRDSGRNSTDNDCHEG